MNKAIFITMRTGSTRLSGKGTVDVGGLPALEFIIKRLGRVRTPARVVLCTTERPEDDLLCEIATRAGINFFRGSEPDKLERWHGAVNRFGIDFFATADGDDLLCAPELIDRALEMADQPDVDFIHAPGIVCGLFTYGIRASALEKVCAIKDAADTEMMWVYFTETGLFNVVPLAGVDSRYYGDDIRMTLDYPEDLQFFRTVIDHFGGAKKDYSTLEILDWIRTNPEVSRLNLYRQNEFLLNQKKKTKLKLKATP
jgi:spore coat polysaccharide biosynthesis protein SpsF